MSSSGRWTDKTAHPHGDSCSAGKRRAVLTHAAPGAEPGNMMISERGQAQSHTRSDSTEGRVPSRQSHSQGAD